MLNARRSRFSHSTSVADFELPIPSASSNNGVSFVDGKEDIAVERQSTGKDRCVYWLKRFPTLFEARRARFIFRARGY